MIWIYHGTGGSGKSLDMAGDILTKIMRSHQNVIANFPVNTDMLYGARVDQDGKKHFKRHGLFYYFDNDHMTVSNLIKYARKLHKLRVEGQTLLCIDECQFFFDPRDNGRHDRRMWLKFFTQHRKLGFNIILTTPTTKLIDKQIMGCIEYTVRHRKMNNAGFIGKILPFPAFCATTRWNGIIGKEGIMEKKFFRFYKKYEDLYDSFRFFDEGKDDATDEKYNIRKNERTVRPEHDMNLEVEPS
jgi:zona occludens toxin (predicted ATPase)